MRGKSWIWLLALAVCPNCSDDDACERICDTVQACGFLPSPLGNSTDNCVARCEASPEIRGGLQKCINGQPAEWEDRSDQRTGNVKQDLALELKGCPGVAVCLQQITPTSDILGYGRVMLLPTENPTIGTDQKVDRACEPAVKPEDAEQICMGWNVARATTILDDGVTSIRTSFGSCFSSLVHQPTWEHVGVGRLRAELVLEGIPAPVGTGGAGGAAGAENDPGQQGEQSAGGQGASGASPTSSAEALEPCFVFPAPIQVNDAGTECVGILLPFDRDIGEAKACERGAACTDSVDNDEDGWTDCDDPKCEDYCEQFMSAAPAAAVGGASGSTEPTE